MSISHTARSSSGPIILRFEATIITDATSGERTARFYCNTSDAAQHDVDQATREMKGYFDSVILGDRDNHELYDIQMRQGKGSVQMAQTTIASLLCMAAETHNQEAGDSCQYVLST
ncbi:hypothetical protein I204_05458 [Kwoniella mangroviensis CBS 8886]|uniref:uncharacterized protein n=1 Tax=Kwoniella mangroviensis CBS 8507 TaxID=1296122 RepID=UPI00080D3328|nr:uncharacterized protein I203_07614 [Kwoniella mangroviensis CBS 8507]OCF63190.1 hypothetical protein I203_07614 [Kwoniella mangroviensis CBS 8507]OCF73615.1 hypothetical protein I204_05458 [Kwoniella mangroviensis CBS 8886]